MATLPIGPHRIEEMLTYCLDLAKQLLAAHGSFFPFGAVLDAEGNRRPVTGDAQRDDARTPDVYRIIQHGMRDQFWKNEIVAGAIVAEVNIPAEIRPTFPSGLRLLVESTTVSRVIYLPYQRRDRANPSSAFEYGELIGFNVQPSLFVQDTQA